MDRDALRRQLRARRRQLRPSVRAHAERLIVHHLARSPWLAPGSRIALYLAAGSECDVSAVLDLAHARGCRVFLPRVVDYRRHRLQLVPDRGRYTLSRHRIAEPVAGPGIAARELSVMFLPLLGFTTQGMRLGSGAGYYDRLLEFHLPRAPGTRPLLVGVGFDCQRIDDLDPTVHDVPLDFVATENGLLHCQWKKNS
jgi:5-formyltetrahydrofolate cyclo-ligase